MLVALFILYWVRIFFYYSMNVVVVEISYVLCAHVIVLVVMCTCECTLHNCVLEREPNCTAQQKMLCCSIWSS